MNVQKLFRRAEAPQRLPGCSSLRGAVVAFDSAASILLPHGRDTTLGDESSNSRMSADEQRKLAAIMFTDMVGYSALSQRDEKLAWLAPKEAAAAAK
jgi:class 3 adenylate cyclase